MDIINTLRNPLSDFIFVFGSNQAGRHGAGAAKIAHKYYGAEYGKGEGLVGSSYALPTKDGDLKTLPLQKVKYGVEQFLSFAKENRDVTFQVTRVGCGLAGYRDEQIAPLFKWATQNVILPGRWLLLLDKLDHARLVFSASSSIQDRESLTAALASKTKNWPPVYELVTDHTEGPSQWAEQWARSKNGPITPIIRDVQRFGDDADEMCRQQMAWYGTHYIGIWDGISEDVSKMQTIAEASGLRSTVIKLAPALSSEMRP